MQDGRRQRIRGLTRSRFALGCRGGKRAGSRAEAEASTYADGAQHRSTGAGMVDGDKAGAREMRRDGGQATPDGKPLETLAAMQVMGTSDQHPAVEKKSRRGAVRSLIQGQVSSFRDYTS